MNIDRLNSLFDLFKFVMAFVGSSVGIGALVMVLVNLLKPRLIPDGDAPKYVKILTLAAGIVLFFVKVYKPDLDLNALDAAARALADNLLLAMPFLMMIVNFSAPIFHNAFRGVPAIGVAGAT